MDTITSEPLTLVNREEYFAGDGEMAALMRAHDWEKTPPGSPQLWPQSLKTIVRILLTSRYAMRMAWGDDLTIFCNDAYRPKLAYLFNEDSCTACIVSAFRAHITEAFGRLQ